MTQVAAIHCRTFLMPMFSRFFLLLALVTAPMLAQRKIGEVRVDVDAQTIPVRVTASTPELQTLADQAFESHGRYRRVASGQAYDFRFTAVTPTQVRVDITRGAAGTPVSPAAAVCSSA